MVIFNSYVKLPEGNDDIIAGKMVIHGKWMVNIHGYY